MKLAIDPDTLLIAGDVTQRAFTAAEFAALEPPDCPVCGLPATVERIDVTLNAEDLAANGRSYILGLWDCPRGCDPRTRQRRHYDQGYGRDPSGLYRFSCSCGLTLEGLAAAELETLRQEHHE